MRTSFEISGEPKTKERPRVTFKDGRAWSYTTKKTSNFEEYVRQCYMSQCRDYFDNAALRVYIKFIYPARVSWSKKKQSMALDGSLKKTTKPDLDNLAKSILDSLNGIAYKDDSQIVELVCTKEYGVDAKTVVEIKEIL